MRPPCLLAVPLVLLALTLDHAAAAAGPSVAQCISASEASLKLRSDHRLRGARAQLLICAAATCPAEVRSECSRRMEQITAAIPTVVFVAKDSTGRELPTVKVTMDGEVVADHLDGTALTLDPGSHAFTFEAEGQPPLTKTIILHEGEKDRRESIVLGSRDGAVTAGSDTDHAAAQGSPVPAIVAFCAGGVGLVVGAVFTVLGISSQHDADTACPGKQCPSGVDYGHYNSVIVGDTVGAVAGFGVAAAGAITGWLLLPTGPADASQSQQAWTMSPIVGPGWAGVAGRAAELEELKARAADYTAETLEMDGDVRLLFNELRQSIGGLGADVVELFGAKTATYRTFEFFLEVIPRKSRLTLLLNLDAEECQPLPENAWDTTQNEFVIYATEDGGVGYSLKRSDDLADAMTLVRLAYEKASQ